MIEQVRREPCKKVETFDDQGNPNGFLVELYTSDGKTLLYLTAAFPKAFKGYHLHTVRASHYVCVRGTMKITVVESSNRVEHILTADTPERLYLPTGVWIGLENVGNEEAWLINYPQPPYDPALKDEQREKTVEEIEAVLRGTSFDKAE